MAESGSSLSLTRPNPEESKYAQLKSPLLVLKPDMKTLLRLADSEVPGDNGRGFSLRVLRVGKPRTQAPIIKC